MVSSLISVQRGTEVLTDNRRTSLPPLLRFFDTEHPKNEFCFFLKTRYLNCLEWIRRPFLYYICHRPPLITPSSSCAALCEYLYSNHTLDL